MLLFDDVEGETSMNIMNICVREAESCTSVATNGKYTSQNLSRWWQLTYLLECSPRKLGKMNPF